MDKNMNISSFISVTGLVLLISLFGPAASAAESDAQSDVESNWHENGWYVGINGGWTKAAIDEERIRSSLLASGFTTDEFHAEESDNGFKIYGGYQFNRYFALEGGYFDLGEFGYTANTTPDGSLSGNIELNGFNLDAVGILPVSDRFSLFGLIGANHAKAEDTFVGTGAVNVLNPNPSARDTKFKFGVGARWAFSDRIALRVEAERYRFDDAVGNTGEVDLYSVGLAFRFGDDRSPRAAAEPVRVIVPAPPTEEYCGILDIQFEIDADTIQREEEEKLSVLATYLQKYPDTTAVIEGHSDNVGSSADNLRLSLRRAESVVDFLVSKYDIQASRLSAVGHGEARPIASNDTQEGQRQNRRIGAVISCVDDIVGLEPVPARITMAMLIEFGYDDAVIDRRYHTGLEHVADFLKANPSVTATIEGHTGNATPARSQEISQLRAQNVMNYLVQNFDIPRWRLNAEGFGETRRFSYNTTAEGRQENRRVNIIFKYEQ